MHRTKSVSDHVIWNCVVSREDEIALTPKQTNKDQTKIAKGTQVHSAQASLRPIS